MEFAFQILQISLRDFFFSMDKFAISFRGLNQVSRLKTFH